MVEDSINDVIIYDNSISDVLISILKEHSEKILENPNKFLALLKDFAPDKKKEIHLLEVSLIIGLYSAIYHQVKNNNENAIVINNIKYLGQIEYSITKDAIQWISELWMFVFQKIYFPNNTNDESGFIFHQKNQADSLNKSIDEGKKHQECNNLLSDELKLEGQKRNDSKVKDKILTRNKEFNHSEISCNKTTLQSLNDDKMHSLPFLLNAIIVLMIIFAVGFLIYISLTHNNAGEFISVEVDYNKSQFTLIQDKRKTTILGLL